MNASIITTIGAVVALLIALWTMFSHFDKRNQDRFDSLQRQIDALKIDFQKQFDALKIDFQKQHDGLKELLRAEMREMRAEIKLEIKDALDRRVIVR